MDTKETFNNSTCVEQMRMAERELASLIGAVTKLYGSIYTSGLASRHGRGRGETGSSADCRAASSSLAR